MSETFGSASHSPVTGGAKPGVGSLLRSVAYLGIVAALTVMGYCTYTAMQARAGMRASADSLTVMRGLTQPTQKHLSPDYSDRDNNLLADAPSETKDLIDPPTLVLAHYIDADADVQMVDWQALAAALTEATGKPVELQEYQNTTDDVAALKSGKIHLAAMHAADCPYVVNNAGFNPFAVLGTEAGANGNRLDIAVPAKSKIEALKDIRGRKLTCSAPDSMTGYRAAIIILRQQAELRPDVDYSITFSHGQKRSIQGLVGGDYSVAALSDDKVQSMLKKGSLQEGDLRVLFQSEVIPRLTIGYVYNLDPALAEKVKSTVLAFENQSGPPDEDLGKPMRFFPISYVQDFEFVRQVDDSFDPRFYKATKAKAPAVPVTHSGDE